MSIATYEIVGESELYKLLDGEMEAVKRRRVVPAESVFDKIENEGGIEAAGVYT